MHAEPSHSATVLLHRGEEIGEFFLLNPRANYGVLGFGKPHALHTGITREGKIFLLPVGLPDSNGRLDQTTQSLANAVEQAKSRWTRIVWLAASRNYEVSIAEGQLDEPNWPVGTLDQRIRIAFAANYIADREHAVVRRLRGCK
ncbi:MAG: hypothetical protein B9S33_17400 [Pedosphaera sp. Tous-C6FEB]|nr:MAG: hypothetical protein B9S33_17400 [Pedosphaera sp. Tous-C6FEB]